MAIIFLFAIFVIVSLFLLDFLSGKTECNLPGPTGLPILGHLPFLKKRPHLYLSNLAKKYGDIFQIKIGLRRVVIVNSQKAIRDILSQWEFSDRPHMTSFRALQEVGKSGIAFFPLSQKWVYLRKTAARSLAAFTSSSSNYVEQLCQESVDYMTQKFREWPKDGAYPRETAFFAITSVIGTLCFGKVFNPDDPILKLSLEGTELFGEFFGVGALVDYLPFLKPIFQKKIKDFIELAKRGNMLISDYVKKHDVSSKVLTVQDALDLASKNKEKFSHFGIEDTEIRKLSSDIFNAGTFTTLEHFLVALRVCAVFPEIQNKLREEIDKIYAALHCEFIPLECKERMPYASAFLDELFRFASHVPLSIAHSTTRDTTYNGYRIPKGSLVMPNFWSVHNDPASFPHPEIFDLTRFLDNSNLAGKIHAFSYGKRKCPGENLARKELFLLVVNVVGRFEIGCSWFEGEGQFDINPGFVQIHKPAGPTFHYLH